MSPNRTGPRKAALTFIMITVLLDMLALGIIIPIFPRLIASFVGFDMARAAGYIGVFGTVWAFMQLFASPVQGALSDRFGRRPVILLSNFGLGFDYIVMALAPNLAWLFVGRIIAGASAASMSTAGAYIADVTPPEERAARFGLLSAAFGVGFVLGPALGGLLGSISPHLPFWAAAGLSLANGLYGLFILPESLPPEKRSAISLAKANPIGALNLLRSHPELLGLSLVVLLYNLAHQVLPSAFVPYTIYRFGWTETIMGLALAGVGVCTLIVQGVLVKPTVARLGERRAALAGLLFGMTGFAMMAAAWNSFIMYLAIPVFSLWGLFSPAVMALMSKRVAADEQGRLQGAMSSIMGLTGLVGPILFTQAFAIFIAPGITPHVPGAPFYLAALLLAFAAALAYWLARPANIPQAAE